MNNQLLNEKESKLFFKYAIPSVLSMVGLSLYILADTYFIANGIGPLALAALNIALPAYSLIFGLAILVGVGGSTLLSIYKGKNKTHMLNGIFSMSIIHAIILSVLFFCVGLFFSKDLSLLLGASESTFDYVNTYVKVIMLLSPLMITNNILTSFVRNDGKPNLAMTAMLIGTLSNIIFDYIFIYIFKWGMFGAALATGSSPLFSLIVVSTHFIRKNNTFKLEKFEYSFYMFGRTISCGMSSLIAEMSSGVVIFLFNLVILQISGEIGVAAYGIIANIALVVTYVFNGIAQGIQPILSVNFGANKTKRLKKIFLLGISSSLVIGVVFYVLGFVFPSQIASVFNSQNSTELLNLTVEGIRIYFIGFLFLGTNVITISFYQSTLKATRALILSILKGLVLIIVLLFLLAPPLQLIGVWLVIPLTELITFILCIAFTIKFLLPNRKTTN